MSMSATTVCVEHPSGREGLRQRARLAIQGTLGRASAPAWSRPGFIALCDQGVVSLTNFATGVIIGRVCGKAELGVYTLAWTLVTMALGVFATLITIPYTVFGPHLGLSRRRRYLGSILVHQLLFSVSLALTIGVGSAVVLGLGWIDDTISNVLTTTAAVIVFISLREFIRNISFADLRMDRALAVDLTASIAQTVGLLLLVYSGRLTASRALVVIGISSGVAAVGWLAFHRETLRADRRLCLPDLKRNWGFAKWVLGSGMLWHCAGYLFPWVLAAFHGTATTGVWAACSAIVALGNPALLGLCNYVLPKISNIYATAGIASMKRYVHRCALLFILVLLPVLLLVAAFGERILTGVYGTAYASTGAVLVVLSANVLMMTLHKPYSQGLFSLQCAKADTIVNVIWVGLLFAVGIPVVQKHGALGAAATMLVAGALGVAIKTTVLAREVRRRS